VAIRTHYDALQVARTATPDVIVAAYRSLSKRYHPDRNVGDAAASARMAELNAAYAVLTDEEKRREHDRWIAREERAARTAATPSPAPLRSERAPGFASPPGTLRREAMWWIAGGVAAGAAVLVALTVRLDHPKLEPDPLPATPVITVAPATPAPDPATAAPLTPLPTRPAGYMDAASANDGGGRSRLTLDNSGGTVAVEVELLPSDPNGARRRAYLPPGGFFVMERVRGGRYRLGFTDLADKSRSTSEPFQLGSGGKPGDLTFRLSQQ
jgi:hypothetical protein